MKRLIIPFVIIFLASCSLNNSSVKSGEGETTMEANHEKLHPGRDTNDLKWQLDSVTRVNISAIRVILSRDPKSDDEFINAGKELKSKTDKLIAECRMKGADHDALHAWLEKFMHDLRTLNDRKANSEDWTKLQEDMKQFDREFS